MSHNHFEGKSAHEHLIDARKKGARALHEHHGTEISGSLSSFLDTVKETAFFITIIGILFAVLKVEKSEALLFISLFSFAYLLWKIGRSALLGWARLERVHRLIEEERHEIKHNPKQEKEELIALYSAKGFQGELLQRVIDVLMADDNRLLEVMLQEELGLTLDSYEHPLKQSLGAAIGCLLVFGLLFAADWFFGLNGLSAAAATIVALSGFFGGKLQNNDATRSVIWNLSIFLLATGAGYFFAKTLLTLLRP